MDQPHISFPFNLLAGLLRRAMPATIEFMPVRTERTGRSSWRWLIPITAKSQLWQHGQFPAAEVWVRVVPNAGGVQVFPLHWVHDNRLTREVDIHSGQARFVLLGEADENALRIGNDPNFSVSATEGECFISLEVKSGTVSQQSPYKLIGRNNGMFGWELKEAGMPLVWKRRYVLWGLWRRLTERPLFGFSGRADRLAKGLYGLAERAARGEQADQERTFHDYQRGISPSLSHARPLSIERKFDAKYRAKIRLLIDDMRTKDIAVPDQLLPPRIAASRPLMILAAELQYYAMKADEQK